MSDVTKNPEAVLATGLAATYHGSLSTSDTYLIPNDGQVLLHFKKTGAGACNVTIATPVTQGGLAVSDQVVQIPATTGDKFIGPFPPHIYNNGNGQLSVTLSEVTGLTFAVLRMG